MAWKLKKIGDLWHCVDATNRKDAGPSDSLAMAKEHLRTLNSDSPTAASEPAGSDVVYCGAPQGNKNAAGSHGGKLKRYHLVSYGKPLEPIHSVMGFNEPHARERMEAIHGPVPEGHDVISHEDILSEKKLTKRFQNP